MNESADFHDFAKPFRHVRLPQSGGEWEANGRRMGFTEGGASQSALGYRFAGSPKGKSPIPQCRSAGTPIHRNEAIEGLRFFDAQVTQAVADLKGRMVG